MKIRNGFVSNSSSSSFIIEKNKITPAQLFGIRHYHLFIIEYLKHLTPKEKKSRIYEILSSQLTNEKDYWDITETKDTIRGRTIIDNFGIMDSLFEILDISQKDVDWIEIFGLRF